MNRIARVVVAGWLALAVAQSHAQSMIAENAAPAAALEGSFAAAVASKKPSSTPSIAGWATAAWHERSPQAMLLLANPPQVVIDMISPVAAGGAINAFGPRVAPVVAVSPVPEPSTYALLMAGLAAVGFMARRRSAR